MKVPISWLKDFVDISLPINDLAYRLTMAGLEVEELHFVGLPMLGQGGMNDTSHQEIKLSGISWEADKIVVGAILEVMPHPNADRLVLCRLDDGSQEQVILTGAPNLFEYKGTGHLEKPLKVAYAKEGARIYDGHQPGQVLVTLKRTKIRGVDSYSMACSEKELGISDDHEGIIILDEDAPVGMPLVEYMGDVVLDIAITPNIARDANILGVAREVAALTGQKLRMPSCEGLMEGGSILGRVTIDIREPELNPRFVLGLIENIEIQPSPYWVQRRLRLAGMRPINNVVDATNFAMLEIGEPLHAFDYDALLQRAGGKAPALYTRRAEPGERLVTLDGVERTLADYTVLVCDSAGPLSLAGVMGGQESEVNAGTRNVLLEGASWNIVNTRRTVLSQNLPSEAAYRFSRGVHPALAELGVRRGLEWMRKWSGGRVTQGLVDNYPLPPERLVVNISAEDVARWLGIHLTLAEIEGILLKLEFKVVVAGNSLQVTVPEHRLDIGKGVVGRADLIEEIARTYGYDLIPETRLADPLPPPKDNRLLDLEEHIRDLLVILGLQEVWTYRMTTPEREARVSSPPADQASYLRLANPIVSDRIVMRRSLLSSLLEVVEANANSQERQALFEIGPVYLSSVKDILPDEPVLLAIALCGPRTQPAWQPGDTSPMDFFDLKGMVTSLIENLHISGFRFEPGQHPTFHPGKCAHLFIHDQRIGVLGELHPLVSERFEFPASPLLAAELDMAGLVAATPDNYTIRSIPVFPPVLEDLAVIVDESIPADRVASLIRQTDKELISNVRLFDVYRGEQVEAGKKSLAYRVTYQAGDRTLTDAEVAQIRAAIVQNLAEIGAILRERK